MPNPINSCSCVEISVFVRRAIDINSFLRCVFWKYGLLPKMVSSNKIPQKIFLHSKCNRFVFCFFSRTHTHCWTKHFANSFHDHVIFCYILPVNLPHLSILSFFLLCLLLGSNQTTFCAICYPFLSFSFNHFSYHSLFSDQCWPPSLRVTLCIVLSTGLCAVLTFFNQFRYPLYVLSIFARYFSLCRFLLNAIWL